MNGKSAYNKGRRLEREFCKQLQLAGYLTWRVPNYRFGTDIFELFDIVAQGRGEVLFVQVRSGSKRLGIMKAREFAENCPVGVRCLWVSKQNRKPFVIKNCLNGGDYYVSDRDKVQTDRS